VRIVAINVPPSTPTEAYQHRDPGPTPIYADEPLPKVDSDPSLTQPKLSPFPERSVAGPSITVDTSQFYQLIESSLEGSTLVFSAGIYTRSLTIRKPLNLVADGRASLHSDGSGEAVVVDVGPGKTVTFDGLSINQKCSFAQPAVTVLSGCASFTNCSIRSGGIASILLRHKAQLSLNRCLVKAASSPCLNAMDSSQVNATGCVFSHSEMIGVTLKLSSVGIFTQCWFKQCAKGGLLATETSQVYVDSSRFMGCNAAFDNDTRGVVTGCAFEGRSEGKDTIACGIVCAMKSSCSVYDNTILSACVDVRENATAELRRNKFVAGELIVWGSSQCNSGQDSFTGEVLTAIRVFNEAHLVASDLKMEKVHKYGIVAENSCDVNMTDVQLASPGNTGVMALEDATVRVANGTIVAAGAFGVVVQAAKRVELSNL
jgi:hypothetical protein